MPWLTGWILETGAAPTAPEMDMASNNVMIAARYFMESSQKSDQLSITIPQHFRFGNVQNWFLFLYFCDIKLPDIILFQNSSGGNTCLNRIRRSCWKHPWVTSPLNSSRKRRPSRSETSSVMSRKASTTG